MHPMGAAEGGPAQEPEVPAALFRLPTRYLDLRKIEPSPVPGEAPRLYRVRVAPIESAQQALFGAPELRPGERRYGATFADGTSGQLATYGFQQALHTASEQHSELLLISRCLLRRDGWLLCGADIVESRWIGRIQPVYRRFDGQDSAEQANNVARILAAWLRGEMDGQSAGISEAALDESLNAIGYQFGARALFQALHQPLSVAQGMAALARARMLAAALVLRACRNADVQRDSPPIRNADSVTLARHATLFAGGALTDDQRAACVEIDAFLASREHRMLLSGDVGTGKTACFLAAAWALVSAGKTAAIIAPNTLVVESIYAQALRLVPPEQIARLTGAGAVGDPEAAPLVIATHALLGRTRAYDALIVDEMHKFSVEQRARVDSHKVIEATATCQPRNVALLTAANTRVARLAQRPRGGRVSTRQLDGADGRRSIVRMIHEATLAGGQCALVYPLRGSTERGKDSLAATAQAAYERLSDKLGPSVALLHGKMSDEQKNAALADLASGRVSVLVSTIVIELGITLPSLRLLIVVDPDRLGLAALHQLRGRVARHGGEGDFVLHHRGSIGAPATERAQALVNLADGFRIASRDAELRGIGDLMHGNAQAGKAASVFPGITLTLKDIEAAAALLGSRHSACATALDWQTGSDEGALAGA